MTLKEKFEKVMELMDELGVSIDIYQTDRIVVSDKDESLVIQDIEYRNGYCDHRITEFPPACEYKFMRPRT